MQVDHIQDPWDTLKAKCGIEGFRLHDLRHTAASHIVMGGVSLYEVSKVLGHSSVTMTKRYSHLADERLAENLERLAF